MIQLDKQTTPQTDSAGNIIGYNSQAVLLPNNFFLTPGIKFDWDNNTCELDGEIYYLDKNVLKSSTTSAIPTKQDWLNTYGNRIEYEYYDFHDSASNPSGNPKNVYRALYIDSQERLKYIFEYTWDAADNIKTTISYAPAGAEAQHDKIIVLLVQINKDEKKIQKWIQNDTAIIGKLTDTSEQKFVGWLYDGSLLPTNEAGASVIVMDDNKEVNAKWLNYTYLSLFNNDTLIDRVQFTEDQSANIDNYVLENTETHFFRGWQNVDGNMVAGLVEMTESLSIYAIWKLKINVQFDCGQGYVAEPLILPEGDVISLDGIAEHTNLVIGYTIQDPETEKTLKLESWSVNDVVITEDGYTIGTEDITITANWVEVSDENPDDNPENPDDDSNNGD